MNDAPPVIPANGRVLVRQLPYKPSKIIEAAGSFDKADECEGIVVALSPFRYGRKKKRDGSWTQTSDTFAHEVKVGDRVLFPGTYQDEDVQYFNGVKHRLLDSWAIVAIITADQPETIEHPVTGEKMPDISPLILAQP